MKDLGLKGCLGHKYRVIEVMGGWEKEGRGGDWKEGEEKVGAGGGGAGLEGRDEGRRTPRKGLKRFTIDTKLLNPR